MADFPVNQTVVYPLTVISNTTAYWEVNNPIVGKLTGAHDTITSTIRIGDGVKHYLDIEPITYIGGSGSGVSVQPATDTTAGVVSNLATEDNIVNATGTGAVIAERLDVLYGKIEEMITSSVTGSVQGVGTRLLVPWSSPRPGYRVLNGQWIELTDPAYKALNTYITLNTDEVITEAEWTTQSTTAGGIGGVHAYCKDSTGRIRLPDIRGDYMEAAGFDGRAALEWREDAIRNITGSMGYLWVQGGNYTGTSALFYANYDNHTYSSGGGTVHRNHLKFDASRAVPTANVNRPRAAGYLPVVYVGAGEDIISEGTRVFLANTRSKHIGEVFFYDGDTDPPGGLILDGRLLEKAAYGALYQHVSANNRLITEAAWQAEKTANGGNADHYSDYSTDQFRIPTYDNANRNWLTLSKLCVQAYHSHVVEN
jgi:hypothetical protein